jgi:hypothetical protein
MRQPVAANGLGRRENVKQFLKDNPVVRQAIEDRVRKELGLIKDVEGAAV